MAGGACNSSSPMKFLKLSWWTAPIAGFYWVRALDLAAGARHRDALAKLSRIPRLSGDRANPMGPITPEYYLLQAHLLFSLGDDNAASGSFDKAITTLNRSKDYSKEEKQYLLAYARSCHERLELPIKSKRDLGAIDLSAIRTSLKLTFPLKTHPDWENRV